MSEDRDAAQDARGDHGVMREHLAFGVDAANHFVCSRRIVARDVKIDFDQILLCLRVALEGLHD